MHVYVCVFLCIHRMCVCKKYLYGINQDEDEIRGRTRFADKGDLREDVKELTTHTYTRV
jgi:hypothetical protein